MKADGKGGNSTEPDGPTTVLVNLFVRSFEKIDDVKMEFSVQITFRQQWNDNRLVEMSRKVFKVLKISCLGGKIWVFG